MICAWKWNKKHILFQLSLKKMPFLNNFGVRIGDTKFLMQEAMV